MSTIIGHPTTVLPVTRNLTSSPDIYADFRELLGLAVGTPRLALLCSYLRTLGVGRLVALNPPLTTKRVNMRRCWRAEAARLAAAAETYRYIQSGSDPEALRSMA